MTTRTAEDSCRSPAPPPTNLTTITKIFEGQRLTTICYKGKLWWIAREVGAVLNYSDEGGRLVTLITGEWADEFGDEERWLVQGEDLRQIKEALGAEQHPTYRVGSLLLLSESGIWKAALLSRKPEGRRLRDWLSGEVLPEIRQTGGYQATLPDRAVQALLEGQARIEKALTAWQTRPAPSRGPRPVEVSLGTLEEQILSCLQPHKAGLLPEVAARFIGHPIPLVKPVLRQMEAQGRVGLKPGVGKTSLYLHPDHLNTPLQKPPGPLDRAAVLLRHIEAGQLSEPFRVRDIYIRGWQGLDKPGAEMAVAELVQRGTLEARPSGKGAKGGRPTMAYHRPEYDDPANLLMRHIEAGDLAEPFTLRDVYIKHWQGLDKAGAEEALGVLVEKGCLKADVASNPMGPRTVRYSRPGGEPKEIGPGVVIIRGRVYAKPPPVRDVRAEILALLRQEAYRGGLARGSITEIIHRRPSAVLKELQALVKGGKLKTRQEGHAIVYFIPLDEEGAAEPSASTH